MNNITENHLDSQIGAVYMVMGQNFTVSGVLARRAKRPGSKDATPWWYVYTNGSSADFTLSMIEDWSSTTKVIALKNP
jgi:hypothetical protein